MYSEIYLYNLCAWPTTSPCKQIPKGNTTKLIWMLNPKESQRNAEGRSQVSDICCQMPWPSKLKCPPQFLRSFGQGVHEAVDIRSLLREILGRSQTVYSTFPRGPTSCWRKTQCACTRNVFSSACTHICIYACVCIYFEDAHIRRQASALILLLTGAYT